jgi:hypothetical protein
MNTLVENLINYEGSTEEPGNDCRVCDEIVGAHSTNSSKIFSTVNSTIVRLKSHANGLVSDIFRHSQTADFDDTAQLETVKNDVKERLKREIKRIDMESKPHPYEDTGICV